MIELCYGDLDIDRAYFVRPRVLGKRGYRTVIRKEGHFFEARSVVQVKRSVQRDKYERWWGNWLVGRRHATKLWESVKCHPDDVGVGRRDKRGDEPRRTRSGLRPKCSAGPHAHASTTNLQSLTTRCSSLSGSCHLVPRWLRRRAYPSVRAVCSG